MFLNDKLSGHMVEVVGLDDLFDLHKASIVGRYHFGEEVQDPEPFEKRSLTFLSGEPLPSCWTNPHYRDNELKR